LVLPKSDDVAVFNAIFRSLRDNLLRKWGYKNARRRENQTIPHVPPYGGTRS
jgi:hypothetical protein